jgi:hypothetical protein
MNPKKIKYILYTFSAIVLLTVVGFIIKVRLDRQKILKEGIRTEATVLELTSERRRKKSDYRMKVALFAKTKPAVPMPTAPAGKPESIDAKMDKLFGNLAANRDIGTYETLTMTISGSTFERLKVGDHVKVAYLRDDPQGAILVWDDE